MEMEGGAPLGPVNGGEPVTWTVEPLPPEPRQTKDEGLPPPLLLLTAAGIPSGVLNGDAADTWRLMS